MIDSDSVMLTIIDADSWAPELYFDVLQDKIREQHEDMYERLWFPTQIFTRNYLDVPMFTRIYDLLHSFAHATNSYSCMDLGFPLSNYTISYKLIKRIGFWDTCADAIGEDFHTAQKTYWKNRYFLFSRLAIPFRAIPRTNCSREGKRKENQRETDKQWKGKILQNFWCSCVTFCEEKLCSKNRIRKMPLNVFSSSQC